MIFRLPAQGCRLPPHFNINGKMDTETDFTENNRAMADFMGIETCEHGRVGYRVSGNPEHLQYHICWDWLMPVIEKIERKYENIDVQVTTGGTRIFEWRSGGRVIADNVGELHFTDKIEHVYAAVVEFLKWRMDPAHSGSLVR